MGICVERICVFCATMLGIVSGDSEAKDFDTPNDSLINIIKYEVVQLHSSFFSSSFYLVRKTRMLYAVLLPFLYGHVN